MKLTIEKKEFNLTSFDRITVNDRPSIKFFIDAKYGEIYELLSVPKQSFIIHAETQTGVVEDVDVSDECIIFESLKNVKNESCELIMSNYSDTELLQQVINDLLGVSHE